jgi:hypothetical protein
MDEKLRCPKCGSELIQPITNAARCGACGHQFALVKDPISRIAQTEKVGWPSRNLPGKLF